MIPGAAPKQLATLRAAIKTLSEDAQALYEASTVAPAEPGGKRRWPPGSREVKEHYNHRLNVLRDLRALVRP